MPSTANADLRSVAEDPAVRAQATLAVRADLIRADLAAKIALAIELDLPPAERDAAREELLTFCVDRLLPQLAATDQILYAAARGGADTYLVARGLRRHHQLITGYVDGVDRARNAGELAAAAHAIAAVLAASHYIERTVLWPAVARRAGLDLSRLVAEVTAADDTASDTVPAVVDARDLPRGNRHSRIFTLYHRLEPGASFELVHGHDPRPLRREFEATLPGEFGWDYLETGPGQWRVRITRRPHAA